MRTNKRRNDVQWAQTWFGQAPAAAFQGASPWLVLAKKKLQSSEMVRCKACVEQQFEILTQNVIQKKSFGIVQRSYANRETHKFANRVTHRWVHPQRWPKGGPAYNSPLHLGAGY